MDVWFFGGVHNFFFFSLVSAFSLYFFFFPEAFLFDLTLRIILQYSCKFNGLFLLRVIHGVLSLCFIGWRHDPIDSRFDEV